MAHRSTPAASDQLLSRLAVVITVVIPVLTLAAITALWLVTIR
jgi:hypothetical protein